MLNELLQRWFIFPLVEHTHDLMWFIYLFPFVVLMGYTVPCGLPLLAALQNGNKKAPGGGMAQGFSPGLCRCFLFRVLSSRRGNRPSPVDHPHHFSNRPSPGFGESPVSRLHGLDDSRQGSPARSPGFAQVPDSTEINGPAPRQHPVFALSCSRRNFSGKLGVQ